MTVPQTPVSAPSVVGAEPGPTPGPKPLPDLRAIGADLSASVILYDPDEGITGHIAAGSSEYPGCTQASLYVGPMHLVLPWSMTRADKLRLLGRLGDAVTALATEVEGTDR